MLKTLSKRRRGLIALSTFVSVAAMGIGMSVPAGASTVPAQNTVLNEVGSQTLYQVMPPLSDLYNSAPGCNLLTLATSNQELNYACASSYSTPAQGLEEGYSLSYAPLNPYNDVVYQDPPYGSSNGIKELSLQGADTPSSPPDNLIAPASLARSSRDAITTGSSPDKSGLNFVGFAADAVSWFHFLKVKNKATDSATIHNLTLAQLTGIYEGSITNWSTVGGSNAPIDVYTAQCGSGTEGTWATTLGLTGTCPFNGVTVTAARYSEPVGDFNPFENEVSDLFTNNALVTPSTNADLKQAIFFFSYGKFHLLCTGSPTKTRCDGTPTAYTKTYAELGQINGVTADQTTILNGSFPGDRIINNVMSDGSNGNLPPVSQAVENFASTYGFLCNPATHNDVDPLSPTNATYGTEIDNIITASGFFPLPLGVMGDGSIPNPPSFTDPNYAAASPTPSGDMGYCRVTSTDGDGNL